MQFFLYKKSVSARLNVQYLTGPKYYPKDIQGERFLEKIGQASKFVHVKRKQKILGLGQPTR